MEFTFNQQEVKDRVQSVAKEILENIQRNMSQGIRETEMYIPKEILYDVCDIIEKETGDNFSWSVVRRGTNQYTGRAEYYTGTSMGNGTFYKKLRYNGN